jgi:apolipoprotein N-acyltransferase
MTVAGLAGRIGTRRLWQTTLLTLVTPLLWAGFEFVRATAFGGFPWNALGVSQWRNLALIQCAEWFGVYGISVLVLLMNAALAVTLLRLWPARAPAADGDVRRYRAHPELMIAILLLVLDWRVGQALGRIHLPRPGSFIVAAVQPAVPQEKKWTDEQGVHILSTLRRLTELALDGTPRPNLVVWPETATPDCVTVEGDSLDLVRDLLTRGVPLLVGSMDVQGTPDDWVAYNSALLFTAPAGLTARYDKQRLVPFGEYIPLDSVVPALRRLAPMGWCCAPGRTATVFHLAEPEVSFAALICFEDTFAELCREFVRNGARLLINQTNDGWFDQTAGPRQHLSQSVFRAVENRVPLIRTANSGITCLIDSRGGLHGATDNAAGRPPRAETRTWAVQPAASAQPLTFYTRYGDMVLGLPCAALALIGCLLAGLAARRSRTEGSTRT